MDLAANPPTIAVHDKCRLCCENLRVKGIIGNSKKLFEENTNEKSLSERLAELGLTLANVQHRSFRVCMKCHRLICRIEESQTTLKAWQKAEVEQSCSAVTTPSATPSATETLAKKRDRVPTPSKLRPQPPTPTAPPAPKVQRPSTGRARQSVTKVSQKHHKTCNNNYRTCLNQCSASTIAVIPHLKVSSMSLRLLFAWVMVKVNH